jgi:hypothetical protein
MSNREAGSCTYEVNDALIVIGADEAFGRFATENGAPELAPPTCLGRSLLACIADRTTAHICRRLFERVRIRGTPVTFPIRCDSPALRRYLRITIARRPGSFLVRSTVDRTEARAPQELLDVPRNDDGTLLTMCGWCKRIDVHGAWWEVEDAVNELGLFGRSVLPAITHGMCQQCHDQIIQLIEAR